MLLTVFEIAGKNVTHFLIDLFLFVTSFGKSIFLYCPCYWAKFFVKYLKVFVGMREEGNYEWANDKQHWERLVLGWVTTFEMNERLNLNYSHGFNPRHMPRGGESKEFTIE